MSKEPPRESVMKILLLNNNPVVNKLVTLSAQKTSDELSIADSVEAIESGSYDLLIVDDALYGEGVMQEINSKIKFNKSLYICAKEASFAEEFTKTLKKPFLPTDLVDMLISLGKITETIELDNIGETNDKFESFDDLDEFDDELALDLDELDDLDDLDEKPKSSIIEENLDEKLELDEFNEDVEDGEFENLEHDTAMNSVLDKDELQEVQNLLEETELEEDLGFDDSDLELEELEEDEEVSSQKAEAEAEEVEEDEEVSSQKAEAEAEEVEDLGFDDSDLELEELEKNKEVEDLGLDDSDLELEELEKNKEVEDLGFDDSDLELEELEKNKEVEDLGLDDSDLELEELEKNKEVEDLGLDDSDLELEEDKESKENKELEEDLESAETSTDEFEDLESQINSAVQALSDEDLQTEVDQDLLFNIDSLSSRDLKLAIGEEVNDEEFDENLDEDFQKVEEFEEDLLSDEDSIEKDGNEGVEALKKLLKALSSEDVVASLKGMKISINITLGDK